jgi:type I restriction enzyme, S subunit
MCSYRQLGIKDISLPIPKRYEQRATVSHLQAVHIKTQRLEFIYRRKLAALGELKKSLLHKAFDGEL